MRKVTMSFVFGANLWLDDGLKFVKPYYINAANLQWNPCASMTRSSCPM